ncbi:serine/arginine repetitive matrix protein 1 isoform X2 [Phlebotomus papatasi]|uniref:serine/arginine repetitive matrix protein 1 isoform X2 n=1 Tax=Phlebotomus papatasi TaxID=29031 RepID=UPI002483AB63|nr:serine/arginine repetitive matrix protein 1 isoform X2 [Phlebotomus papatasi]
MSIRRRDVAASNSKLRMDRQPMVTRITDPSLAAGKRKEIDNVMKKARASTGEYWDKKLLEVEEKDPNRWRHSGYKKLYIEGESSSEDSDAVPEYRGYSSRQRSSRSRSRGRRSPPRSPDPRRRTPRSPEIRGKRPRSPVDPPMRRRSPRSPRSPPRSPMHDMRRRSPMMQKSKAQMMARSKRPPSPPPKPTRSPSKSSLSSCSDDSCSVCSPKPRHAHSRSRSVSLSRSRPMPRSPPMASKSGSGRVLSHGSKSKAPSGSSTSGYHSGSRAHVRPVSPRRPVAKVRPDGDKVPRSTTRHIPLEAVVEPEPSGKHGKRSSRKQLVPEDPRLKVRPPEPPQPVAVESSSHSKRHKDKAAEKLRAKVKIEGEKRKKRRSSSSGSDDSSSSSNSLPAFTAATRLTLSERFGKMAQWSVDRSNMENMRITKDSAGGALKVMIEEGLESPPARNYSPAPPGHFPEELAMTAPTGLMSWDDVRVRYEYYKSRGYLRDLDLQDYIKWEEWWYRYQEWLKQERYYEFLERQQMRGRRRKKIPITQRLN